MAIGRVLATDKFHGVVKFSIIECEHHCVIYNILYDFFMEDTEFGTIPYCLQKTVFYTLYSVVRYIGYIFTK